MLSVTQENLKTSTYTAPTILQQAGVLHPQRKTNEIWQVGPNIYVCISRYKFISDLLQNTMQTTHINEKQVGQKEKQNRQKTTMTTKERSSEGNKEVTQRHMVANAGVKKENITIKFEKELKLKRQKNIKVVKENITIKPSVPTKIASRVSNRPGNKSNLSSKLKEEMGKSRRSNDMPFNVLNTQKIEKETKHTVNQKILDIKNRSKPKSKDNQHTLKDIGKSDGKSISFKPQQIDLKTHLITVVVHPGTGQKKEHL